MVHTLLFRAKDVCRVAVVLMLWLAAAPDSYAQSVASRKVNCAFQATRLDEVIRHLSQETGVSFIYSSNKTDLSKEVTLAAVNRPLEETLTQIGTQLNLEFKLQGRYVMIKPAPEPVRISQNKAGKVPVAVRSASAPAFSHVAAFYQTPEPDFSVIDRTVIPALSERSLPALSKPFGRYPLSALPLGDARKISTDYLNRGWFVSVGSVLGDYASGFEIQAGLRSVYLVFTPTWMGTKGYRGAYGVGTSVNLTRNFSFVPVYSIGTAGSSSTERWRNTQGLVQLKFTERITHHQFKLMWQYDVSPSVFVKLGPTINQTRTRYASYQSVSLAQLRPVSVAMIKGDANTLKVGGVMYDNIQSQSSLLSEQLVRRFWIGWEASVGVRIDFFKNQ